VSSATTTSIITGTGENKCSPAQGLLVDIAHDHRQAATATVSAMPAPMKPPPTIATDSISLMRAQINWTLSAAPGAAP
jgi:hypothetical protein